MKIRSLLFCIIVLIPLTASADDTTSGQAQAPQSAVGASDLLPQSKNQGGGSSMGASSVLQPNASSLQGSAGDGSSLSAPADQTLQAAPTSDGLKVIVGADADGSPHNLSNENSSQLGENIVAIALGVLILCGTLIFLRRKVAKQITL